ncbi:Gfo/Idh/MocA family protein [Brachybacterium huguangmaarense]
MILPPPAAPHGHLELPASTVPDPGEAPAIRWGIVSPGGIAGKFARSVHAATASRIVSVCSRSLERAESFAAEHVADGGEAPRAFDDVAAMLEAGGIDAVYVASPHAQHHEYARPLLEAGMPVLVEKAFTLDRADAEDLFDTARSTGTFAAEAMWTRYLPQMDVLAQVVASGMLGEIVSLAADHGQSFDPDPEHRLFAPELGGGALLDLGVYPISFAQALLGDLSDLAIRGSLTETGVDAHVSLLARGARGGTALLDTTLASRTPTLGWIAGTRGRASLSAPFYVPGELTIELTDGRAAVFEHPGDPELGMAYEAAEVARCLAAGVLESPRMTWADTLSVMGTMDAVRAELGVVYPGESSVREDRA